MKTLAEKVVASNQRHVFFRPGDRVAVAVSGGADSVALLRLLLELRADLGLVLSVVHFNHQLRGEESGGDERFVAQLALHHEIEFHTQRGDVNAYAKENRLNLEAAAREMRYTYFQELMLGTKSQNHLSCIATAHTLDDQAETVLMRIIRGTGTRGLGAIQLCLSTSVGPYEKRCGRVVRPLLQIRHRELVDYLKRLRQEWREDSSNQDIDRTRNRVRTVLIPLLEREFNPATSERLADLAEISRVEENYWRKECDRLSSSMIRSFPDIPDLTIDLDLFKELHPAVQRRLLNQLPLEDSRRVVLDFQQTGEILLLARNGERDGKEVSLPGGWKATRRGREIQFAAPKLQIADRAPRQSESHYEYALRIPGRVAVPEAGVIFEVVMVPKNCRAAYNPNNLLERSLLTGSLRVRNWRAGDRFWPAHTKAPKKIKELLQELHLTGLRRHHWPVVACGDEIVWLRGFASPARLHPPGENSSPIAIVESALEVFAPDAAKGTHDRDIEDEPEI